jgi:hypothetical protein
MYRCTVLYLLISSEDYFALKFFCLTPILLIVLRIRIRNVLAPVQSGKFSGFWSRIGFELLETSIKVVQFVDIWNYPKGRIRILNKSFFLHETKKVNVRAQVSFLRQNVPTKVKERKKKTLSGVNYYT